jgi:putative colanic acid biosynthesis UDP-glucose lipid carrier transferase
MITHRSRGLYALHASTQAVLALVLFWTLALVLSPLLDIITFARLDRYVIYSLVISAAVAAYALRAEQKKKSLLHIGTVGSLRLALRQVFMALTALLLFLFATKDAAISRIFLSCYIPVLWLGLAVSNRLIPRTLAGVFFEGSRAEGALLMGSVEKAARLQEWLHARFEYGIHALGVVADDVAPETIPGLPVLGKAEDLDRLIRETGARQVVLVELPEPHMQVARLVELCERHGIRFIVVNDLEDRFGHPVTVAEEDGLQFLSLRSEPLENPFNRLLKRLFDLAIAIPVLVLLYPVTAAVVWLLQRWQSPGPLLFHQLRTGMHGREFTIYKFRTMHTDHADETRQATHGDGRIFSAGAWLRSTSIDELPQFWNVLRGEMSVVGPRPHLREHDERFTSEAFDYRIRSLIKPGITGLAQVRGFRGIVSDASDIIGRVELDLHYLENWSPLLDTVIILRTAFCVVAPPKNAL